MLYRRSSRNPVKWTSKAIVLPMMRVIPRALTAERFFRSYRECLRQTDRDRRASGPRESPHARLDIRGLRNECERLRGGTTSPSAIEPSSRLEREEGMRLLICVL